MNEQPSSDQASPASETYDGLLLVSFGGPDGPDDVIPFLENVLRGKNVPRERMLEVAEHYQHFGGVSPINQQNRELLQAIEQELERRDIQLPVYWGNRNWHPMLNETLQQMHQDGIRRSLAFFTSMFSCYSGCRQYRENIAAAQSELGGAAPAIEKLRMGYNHPLFIEASAARVNAALSKIAESNRESAHILFTAHSIPNSMADYCDYQQQLQETCRLVMQQVGQQTWELVYQSRSGPPHQPWLEPDVCDHIQSLNETRQVQDLVIMPVGFISDHMEVKFDLDTEAQQVCQELGINMVRAQTVGTHPLFVRMIIDLVEERLGQKEKQAIGQYPPNWDVCPTDCCQYKR